MTSIVPLSYIVHHPGRPGVLQTFARHSGHRASAIAGAAHSRDEAIVVVDQRLPGEVRGPDLPLQLPQDGGGLRGTYAP